MLHITVKFNNQVRRLQNGGVTSEEDVSLSGAQGIRCRVGSYSGGPDQHMNKEDTYSPGESSLSNYTERSKKN